MSVKSKGMSQLLPVESASLNEKVYAQLRQSIMNGKFRPGDTLTLRGLATALGTSIMPARDAVLRLSAERALESIGRSARIPVLSEQRFRDVLRFRIALEGEACALAAERATSADMEAIQRASERADTASEASSLDRFLAANREFHFAVYRGAHNDLLQSMIETLWLQIGPHLAQLAEASRSYYKSVDLSAHQRLIAAVKKRDPQAAREALKSDLTDREDLLALTKEPVVRSRKNA